MIGSMLYGLMNVLFRRIVTLVKCRYFGIKTSGKNMHPQIFMEGAKMAMYTK